MKPILNLAKSIETRLVRNWSMTGFAKQGCRTNYLGVQSSKYKLEDAVEAFAQADKSTPIYRVKTRCKDEAGELSTVFMEQIERLGVMPQKYREFLG